MSPSGVPGVAGPDDPASDNGDSATGSDVTPLPPLCAPMSMSIGADVAFLL
eukprot:CAMPEP_0179473552 /NCGR_PEP_ID=MMETSP0799-20121207/53252_1 /TAXON_ID=46947 /ORGANISM="Geminigera cryophila, Strain CCMP2564" /LENGTH=50 /DNA_ID=CAMNT_0021282217 /DNA_START=447 /DNA_END=599 /DNA_ORIENTATION=-